jgi:putative DeoR family transcriptional regulator (stage III sporulation protein D)
MGVSKSTVALDIKRLEKANPQLLESVRAVVEDNKALRHIRGGQSIRKLYMKA